MKKYYVIVAMMALLLSGCGSKDENKTKEPKETVVDTTTIDSKEGKENVGEVNEMTSSNVSQENLPDNSDPKTDEPAKTDEPVKEPAKTSSGIDAMSLYMPCAGCHGARGEKVALGKSKVIKDMSEADIVKAMLGYKDGTYGGPMKGVMTAQVKKLDKAQIEALSKYIKR